MLKYIAIFSFIISFAGAAHAQPAQQRAVDLETEIALKSSGVAPNVIRKIAEQDIEIISDDRRLKEQSLELALRVNRTNSPAQVVVGAYVDSEFANISDPNLRKIMQRAKPQSDAEKQCNLAASLWQSKLSSSGGTRPDVSLMEVATKARRSGTADFIAKAQEYDAKCLKRVNEFPQDLVNAGLLRVVGAIIVNDFFYCGAARVSADVFVTARHCLFNLRNGEQILAAGQFQVALFEDLTVAYDVSAISTDSSFVHASPIAGPFTLNNDFVFFKVSGLNSSMPLLEIDFAEPGEEALLAGYFRFHNPAQLLDERNTLALDPSWREGFRWSANDQCFVGEVRDPCRAHYCQSDAMFSGSPLLGAALRGGKIVLAGLHLAAMGSPTSCAFQYARRAGNIAISFPPAN